MTMTMTVIYAIAAIVIVAATLHRLKTISKDLKEIQRSRQPLTHDSRVFVSYETFGHISNDGIAHLNDSYNTTMTLAQALNSHKRTVRYLKETSDDTRGIVNLIITAPDGTECLILEIYKG